jgi:transposase-like protein
MAARKAKKQSRVSTSLDTAHQTDADQVAESAVSTTTQTSKKRGKRVAKRAARRVAAGAGGKRRGRRPGGPRKRVVRTRPAKPAQKKAASRRGRARHSDAQRRAILATARREGLTGADVAKRFGISTVTYYLWRKKARPAIRQAAKEVRQSGVLDLADEIRQQLRDQIRRMVPAAIRNEIESVLADVSGTRGRRPGRR